MAETPRGKPGFESSVPGLQTAPVAHAVRKSTRDLETKTPERLVEFNKLSRTIRIVNRAEVGPLKGKPFMGVHSGEQYPDEIDSLDDSTWLQPGEYMDVPKEVALHLCGNLWDPSLPGKVDVTNRYGGLQYVPPAGGSVAGRTAPMIARGMPLLPDLMACEINTRGKVSGEWKSMYELYTKGLNYSDELFEEN